MILDSMSRFKDVGLLILRVAVGVTFIFIHGAPKISGGPEMWEKIGGAMGKVGLDFLPVMWGFMAAFSEFFGGILLVLGLIFRPTAALMAFTMIIAMVHHLTAGDPIGAAANPFRLAAVFIALFFLGAGKYSLDYFIWNRKKE